MQPELDMHKNEVTDDKKEINNKEISELEKFWITVRETPSDFTGWTYLLQYVEQENNLPAAREAFDAFLDNYPYCYGYWKKYADLEKKLNSSEKAEEIFERGLKSIWLSVDLWSHYINFYKSAHKEDADCYSKVRIVFERAIQAAGREFRSDRLWDLYISWEMENNNLKEVTAIYDRVLATPTQLYIHHFEKFQDHVNHNPPKDVLTTDEFLLLRQDFLNSKKKPDPSAVSSTTPSSSAPEEEEEIIDGGGDALPPGVDAEDVPPGLTSVDKPEKDKTSNTEECVYVRRKVIQKRRDIFKINEEEVGKRWNFEEGIKRPYFHVKPLERAQLRNWREYLDFEIASSSHEKIVILFERCMIACALYEDMWMKYAKYMETVSPEAVREVFERACLVHLRRKPTTTLAWVSYEERHGHYDEAIKALDRIERNLPEFLEVTLRRINIERRRGRNEQVAAAYRDCIAKARTAPMISHFSVKLARFLYKVQKDFDKAKIVLKEAIERDPTNSHLHMQLVDVAFQKPEIDEAGVIEAFDAALNSDMNEDEKLIFAQRKLEFLEDFGMDPFKIQDAFDEYYKYAKSLGSSTKKRQLENTGDDALLKKPKSEMNGGGNGNATSGGDQDAAMAAMNAAGGQAQMANAMGGQGGQMAGAAGAGQDPNMAYNYAQQWGNYPQAYNYQQAAAWGNYPAASYYPTQ